MMRSPISPACALLLQVLSPGANARLNRCRSVGWKSLSYAGEKIELEWICKDEELDRAEEIERQARESGFRLPGTFVADVAVKLTGSRLLVQAVTVSA